MNISFKNDYSEGCHPNILAALSKYNLDQQNGYGLDAYCENARELLLKRMKARASTVYFVSGGTQANLLVASACMRPHESIISASTGHIYDNEAGAIEATGHKVHGIDTPHGKLRPSDLQQVLDAHTIKPHQLKQKMVYISNPTEIGTIYTKSELKKLSKFCKAKQLYLFLDGARLGNALMAKDNDLSLADIAKLTDVFYIGGTKNGALIGEAIVINNKELQEDFGYHLKQKGALLSKGRVFGIQFQELFQEDLYFQLAKQANKQAMKIKSAFEKIGCEFWADTTTNQIFPILENEQIEQLLQNFDFYVWRKIDDRRSAIRIITSWATAKENVRLFVKAIKLL